MAPSTNPDDIARQARERLEADANIRVEAVRHVAESAREAEDRDQALRAANAAHAAAWAAAVTAGWSDKDLRQMGLRPPTSTAPSPGRRRNRQQPGTGDSEAGGASSDG